MQTSENMSYSTLASHLPISSDKMVELAQSLTCSVVSMGIHYAYLSRLFSVPGPVAVRIINGEFALRKNDYHDMHKADLLIHLYELLLARFKTKHAIREWLTTFCDELNQKPQEFIVSTDGILELHRYLESCT